MDRKSDSKICVNKMIKITYAPDEDCPTARSGHRAVANEGHMWVIGGYNPEYSASPLFKEMWHLNITTGQWDLVRCKGNMPVELASHSALYDNGHMLVFGGTGYPFGANSSNKLSICNLKTGEWKVFWCSGTHPDEKYGQAMVIHDRKLLVYGGTSGFLYNTDLHELNLETFKWTKVIPDNVWSELPPERYRHEVALYNDNLVILGGGTSTSVHSLKKLHSFNWKTKRWTCQATHPDPSQSPGYPAPRRCHGCVQLEDEAIISGGYNGHCITGDVWKINLETMRWTKITDMAEPVYFHSVAVTPNGCMYVFGGVSSIDPNIRTNGCYKLWLRLPSLQTLCWQKLISSFPQLLKLPRKKLTQLGIHRHFINQLPYPDGA